MTARGIRNNNPTNIRYVEGVTSTYRGCTGKDDAGFCVFDNALNGIRAGCLLLLSYQDKHDLKTVRGIINRWAPPTENETSLYVTAVANETGFLDDVEIDLHSPMVLAPLVVAIIRHENGEQPYPPDLIMAAVNDALGIATTATTAAPAPAQVPIGQPMPIIALLAAFGPLLSTLIPQIAKAISPDSTKTQQGLAIAGTVLNAVTSAAGATNVQAAVEAMQRDPALVDTVTKAVVNDPQIMVLLEVGGGIAAARVADQAVVQAEKPFWYSQVFWLTILFLPIIYGVVYRVMWAVKADGTSLFSTDMQATVITAIIVGLLGAITGFMYGSALGNKTKDDTIANLSKP